MSRGRASGDDLWAAVDGLVDRAPTVADLRSHRLELFAARRWRLAGRAVPPDMAQLERAAAVVAMTVPVLLRHVRAAYAGPAILHKGPEVAAHYPDPTLRMFGDIDLLVPNAEEAQRALLAAGFELTGDPEIYRDIHHLQPLQWEELPVVVEIHSRPKWVDSLSPPTVVELLDAAVPSTVDDDFLALPPAQHALLLAAHSWAHDPLRRLRDLIDIAAVAASADRAEVVRLAREWGAVRLWRSTDEALASVLTGAPAPLSVRTWARNVANVRERTVLEHHMQRWLSNFWILPRRRAALTLPTILLQEVRPAPHETWGEKLRRTARALRNASRRRSEHEDELARTARRH